MQLSMPEKRKIVRSVVVFLATLIAAATASANGEITTHEETTSIVVPLIISLIGGAVASLGIYLAAKGGRAASNLRITFGANRTVTLTRLTQGVVIVLIGATILVAGLYNLPKVKKEETIKAKTIEEQNGKRVLEH